MPEESQSAKYTGVFCTGVKNLFGRHMWSVIKRRVAGVTKLSKYHRDQLRGRLDVTNANLSQFETGALSDKLLYAFVTDLKMSMSEFDALPSQHECAVEGYRYLVRQLERDKKQYLNEIDVLDIHLFMALLRIIGYVRAKGVSPTDWTDREWEDICKEFIPTLPGGGEVLRMHYEEHAKYIAEAVAMVKYRWISDEAN